MTTEIPDGDFYTCMDEADEFCWETPEEALHEFFEYSLLDETDVSAAIAKLCPVTLYVYRRVRVPEDWSKNAAVNLLEKLGEDFAEKYGNPESGEVAGLDDKAERDALPAMEDAVRRYIGHARVYLCGVAATVKLDAPQVEAMLREHCPEWWDKERAKVMTRLLSDRERHVMEHAIALNHPRNRRLYYRNRFVAGPGHADWDTLQALVACGWMAIQPPPAVMFPDGMTVFTVTPAGLEALGR